MALVRTPDVDVADDFRLTMRNVAAAVAVVTAFDESGEPHGTTVSAFTPLSMEPPLLLVSLDNTSRLLDLAQVRRRVGINVLGVDQQDVAQQFAARDRDRWLGISWHDEGRAPALSERLAYIAVSVERRIRAGDHTLLIGAVHRATWDEGAPLTYWQRSFGSHRED